MTNNAAKFALGLAVAGLLAAVAAVDDKVSMLLFVGLFLAGAAVAYGLGRSVGADLPPKTDDAVTAIDPTDVPQPSYGPIVAAIGATTVACGGALGPRYVIVGLVLGLVGAAVWLLDSFRVPGTLDPRVAENVDNRLLGPLALPVGAFILAITIAFSFSRVLLAISETASWIVAFIVAAMLLLVLTLIASRVPTTRAVVAMAAVALVAVLAAGATGADVGERSFEHHEDELPIVEMTAQNIAFDRNVIGLPGDSDVELIFTNLDKETFHNVAIYNGDPGTAVFNGKPIAKGSAVYKFKTPAPGTYRYVCDFHPAMTGELRLVQGGSKG